ncbi:hypothetical protein [Xanthomonas campestris]|uniref:hypothetical protein n=1 Tax=Xanthomonas campestris TaxID=339 RepID=UPI00388ECB75
MEFNMGFKAVKQKVVAGLLSGDYAHDGRADIDDKNLLKTGKVSPQEVAKVLKKSSGKNHSSSLHHQDSSIEVHVIKCRAWYVKFYFDPDAPRPE